MDKKWVLFALIFYIAIREKTLEEQDALF